MMHTKSLVVLAGAALGLSSIAAAQSADESRAAARELKTDASTRSSFQGDGPSVRFGGYEQFYYHVNHRDDVGDTTPGFDDDDDDLATGFRAKTKLTAEGDITEEWSVKFQGVFDTDGGAFRLDDILGIYTMDNGWSFGVGQAKLPFLAEELVKDTGQLAASRSIVADNSVTGGANVSAGGFNAGRGQGVFFNYQADTFRFMGAFSDGANTANSEFTSGVEADFGITGRFEWMWAGEWDRFKDFTSFNGQENAGKVGGAIHYQDGGETFNTADQRILGVTADVAIEGSGWNAFGAFVYTSRDPNVTDSVDDMAIMGQGGWFVSDDWELFARLAFLLPDDNDQDGNPANGDQDRDDFWTITGGTNFYITPQSQNVKLTLQLTYMPDEQTNETTGIANVGTSNNSQILTDDESGQWTASAGLQFIF